MIVHRTAGNNAGRSAAAGWAGSSLQEHVAPEHVQDGQQMAQGRRWRPGLKGHLTDCFYKEQLAW